MRVLRGDDVRADLSPFSLGVLASGPFFGFGSLFVNRGSLVGSYRLAEVVALSGTGTSLLWRKRRTPSGKSAGPVTVFISTGEDQQEDHDVHFDGRHVR